MKDTNTPTTTPNLEDDHTTPPADVLGSPYEVIIGDEDKYDAKHMLIPKGDKPNEVMWSSIMEKKELVVKLPDLHVRDPQRKNTVVCWATMPPEAMRFAFNIQPNRSLQESSSSTVIFHHFSAREYKNKRSVIQNAFRDKAWMKQPDRSSVNPSVIQKGEPFEYRVTVCERGYAVFVNGVLVSEFQHRMGIQGVKHLYFVVPIKEETYGDEENVAIHGLWWGRKEHQWVSSVQEHQRDHSVYNKGQLYVAGM